jgi:opacity protein-like surface antigen
MKRAYVLAFALLTISFLAMSQSKDFKPGGKPFMKVFSNFNTSFSDGESVSAFEINRLYLGYEYAFSENLSAKANFDIGDPGVGKLEMTAFVKNAYLKYQKEKLTVHFGMIATTQFKIQEGIWGYRYLAKSFQDEYKFNSSADLGVSIDYKISDMLSADMIIANGEGYKSLQSDSTLRTGFGITVTPMERWTGRIYYDFSSKDQTQSSIVTFVGYEADKFSLGAEYNMQFNVDFEKDHEWSGTSFYGTVKAFPKVSLFGRYDHLFSNTLPGETTDWNHSDDGHAIMAGVEYAPVKGVKLTPNVQTWNPAKNGEPGLTTLFLSCEIKF